MSMNYAEIIKYFGFQEIITIDNDWKYLDDSITLDRFLGYLNPEDATKLRQRILLDDIDKQLTLANIDVNSETMIYIQNFRIQYESLSKLEGDFLVQNLLVTKSINENIDKLNTNTKKIWFIDLELDNASRKHIILLFSKHIKNKDNHDVFIIYTKEQNVINSYDSVSRLFADIWSKDNNLINDYEFNEIKSNLLCVNILKKNSAITSDEIVNILQKASQNSFFTYQMSVLSDTIESLKKEMWNSDNQLLFEYDYLSEGFSVDENLFGIVYKNFHKNYNSNRSQVSDSIRQMNAIMGHKYSIVGGDEIKKIKNSGRIRKRINDYSNPDYLDDFVEEQSADVATGDLFLINKTYYIVLSQACDLVVREDGERKNKSIKLMQVEIKDCAEKDYVVFQMKAKHVDSEVKWKTISDEVADILSKRYDCAITSTDFSNARGVVDSFYLKFGNESKVLTYNKNVSPEYFDDYLLDLCIFQKNGIISLNNEIPSSIRSSLRIKIDDAKCKILNNINSKDQRTRLKSKFHITYNKRTKKFDFCRIGRLPYTIVEQINESLQKSEFRSARQSVVKI